VKKRHEDWLKLTTKEKPKAANNKISCLRILDLLDFKELEDKLLIYRPIRGEMSPELEKLINELSEKTFGVTKNDTLFVFPSNYNDLPDWSPEKWGIDDRYSDHEDQFETAEATDDEAVVILLRNGLDFRDRRGNPLLSTKLFCRQAEAAAKGIMGKVPDRGVADLESWTKHLERDVKQHMSKKRAG
jgi:hypothetical protein